MPNMLITGANRGLGMHLAKHFAKHGWELYVTGRDVEGLRSAYAIENVKYKSAFEFDLMSVSSSKQISNIFKQIPQLEAVIHCAAPYDKKSLAEMTEEDIRNYSQSKYSDLIFAKTVVEHLGKNSNFSVFLATGAIIGLPNAFGPKLGLIGLQKAHLRL